VTGVCVPSLNNLCLPCLADAECGVQGDLCLPLGVATFCGRDCTFDACPDGYECREVTTVSTTARQCIPANGTCDCTQENTGLTRGCRVSNDLGVCFGAATCDPQAGWLNCSAPTPAAEICNGIDDDCDGFVDDQDHSIAYPNGSADCPFGIGCVGRYACDSDLSAGYTWVCRYERDTTEQCNGVDDNCDGHADEPFVTDTGTALVYDRSIANCGACGSDCSVLLPFAQETRCVRIGDAAHCEPVSCREGAYLAVDGLSCLPLVSTLCQSCTDDADCLVPGSRCLSLADGGYCGRDCSPSSLFSTTSAPCTGAVGVEDCCGAGFLCKQVTLGADTVKQCEPAGGTCSCDAQTKTVTRQCLAPNIYYPTQPCRGIERCQESGNGYAWSACAVDPTVVEICNHRDDDCNGLIDEAFIDTDGTGTYDTDEHCGECYIDCLHRWDFNTQHAAGACNTIVSPFSCDMVCATETGWVDANGNPDDGCECQLISSRDDPDADFGGYPVSTTTYRDANCDGIDGVIGDALFVSASNPVVGTGSIDDPYQSIGLGIANFAASGKKYILVAGGIYDEQVVIEDGIQMHGGYSDNFRSRNIVLFPSVILGPEPASHAPGVLEGSLNVVCTGWSKSTLVSGFFVYGYEVTVKPPDGTPGYPSYAAYLMDCDKQLSLLNSAIVGGIGGPGPDGVAGAIGYGAGDAGSAELNAQDGARHPTSRYEDLGDCTTLTVQVAGGAPGHNSHAGCNNWGQAGGGTTCPRYFNNPDVDPSAYTPSPADIHAGYQAEYKTCTTTFPDCCPYTVIGANPRDPATWPVCAVTPYVCVVPAGETRGACVKKRTCAVQADCPVGYLCQGAGAKYCELPGTCALSDDCPSGFNCAGTQCTPAAYGGNGPGAFDSTMNVVQHGCNQITESGFPVQIDPLNGAAGAMGGTGHSGIAGAGCAQASGSVVAGEWIGVAAAGGAGGTGQPGQPGGGGGAGGGIAYHDPPGGGDCLRYEIGASGGGGGGGGCGGGGGTAGQPGGGSVALLVGFSSPPDTAHMPNIRDNNISRGPGGPGGRGGAASLGGYGGTGGNGAVEDMGWGVPYASGAGGRGGRGGAGGGGGGGCGGSSFGLLLWNTYDGGLVARNTYATAVPGSGGRGGVGGMSPDPARQGGVGVAGLSMDSVVYCGPGGVCPTGTSCSNGRCS
jgi:hypothetical protein